MKKALIIALIFSLAPLAVHSAETSERSVSSVSVTGQELILIAKKRLYFWKSCSSVGLDAIDGYDAISLGDTIKYKNFNIPVGVIRYVEHEEVTTSSRVRPASGYLDIVFSSYSTDADMNIKLAPHKADCLIASDEAHLPNGNSCENTWILVEGCSVLKE